MKKNFNNQKEVLLKKIYEQFFYNSEENKPDEIEEKFSKLCKKIKMRQPRRILCDEEKAFKCRPGLIKNKYGVVITDSVRKGE